MQRIGRFKNLEELSLQYAAVAGELLRELQPLGKMRRVILGNSYITGSGLRYLNGCKSLEELGFFSTPFEDSAVDLLSQSPELKKLSAEMTPISDASVDVLPT